MLSGTFSNTTDPEFAVLDEESTGEGINVIKASLNLTPEQVYAGINTNTKLRKIMSNYLHVGLSCTAQTLAWYKLELENVIQKQLCLQHDVVSIKDSVLYNLDHLTNFINQVNEKVYDISQIYNHTMGNLDLTIQEHLLYGLGSKFFSE